MDLHLGKSKVYALSQEAVWALSRGKTSFAGGCLGKIVVDGKTAVKTALRSVSYIVRSGERRCHIKQPGL